MPDLKTLATKLPKDKDYRGGHGDVRGFVCPRADGFGGRDGIISPGIAAERGLVPRGMRHVTIAQAIATVNEQVASGQSEQERYLAYYGKGARENANPAQPASANAGLPPEVAEALLAKAQKIVAARMPATPQRPAKPAKPRTHAKTASVAVKAASKSTKKATKTKKQAVKPVRHSVSPVFPADSISDATDDTLDGFYDSLRGARLGSPDCPPRRRCAAPSGAVEAAAGASASPREPRTREAEVLAVAQELARDLLARMDPRPEPEPESENAPGGGEDRLQAAQEAYAELNRDYLALEQEVRRLKQELQSRPAAVAHDTVRVTLGDPAVRLKVGGHGWECKVEGHLCYSRSREEVVLVVSDTGYGSELLGAVQRGECVLVSAAGRTACAYDGDCAKIYGEPGSPEFITCLRFSCDPERAQA